MPRVLSPDEVQALGLEQPEPRGRVLSPSEVADLGLESPDSGPSGMDAFGRGAAQGATLGFGDEIEGAVQAVGRKYLPESLGGGGEADAKKPLLDLYRDSRGVARRQNAEAEQAHGGAYFAGNVVGGAAPGLLVPGGGGLAGIAKTGAVLGAANGLGTSNADLTHGEVQQAARDTGIGGLTGAATAVGGALAGKALAPVARAVGRGANSLAVRALGGTAGEIKKLGADGVQRLGNYLLDEGAVRFGSSPEAVAGRAAALEESAGQDLGNVIGKLDQTGAPGVSKTRMVLDLLDEAKRIEATKGPGAKATVNRIRQAARDIAMHDVMAPDEISFAAAENFKKGFQEPINFAKKNPSAAQMGDREVASTVRQSVEDAAEAQVPQDLADEFLAAKKRSGLSQAAGEMAEGAEGRRLARNIVSPSGTALQVGGALAAVAAGHPLAALPAMATGAIYSAAKARAPAAMAVTMRGTSAALTRIVQTNPAALGRFGSILSNAFRSGGQAALDAHSFVLGQTDPQFQETLRKLGEEPTDGGQK